MNNAFKIDSPLAKIMPTGQVTCLLCKTNVKSPKVWTAHVNGKQHREKIIALKSQRNTNYSGQQQISTGTTKPVSTSNGTLNKRPPPPASESENLKQKPRQKRVKLDGVSSSLPANFFDQDSVTEGTKSHLQDEATTSKNSTDLPPDFFDGTSETDVMPWEREAQEKKTAREPVTPKENTAEALPEGFFDDPSTDKKVRKADPKDPLDEEWALFQKEMQSAATTFEAIVEEEDEEAQTEREIEEVDKQITQWAKVNELQQQKEDFSKTFKQKNTNQELTRASPGSFHHSDEETDLLDEILDWRCKQL